MDGKTILIIALAAGLAFWLGTLASRNAGTEYAYTGPAPVDTGDTGTVSQRPDDPGGVLWT